VAVNIEITGVQRVINKLSALASKNQAMLVRRVNKAANALRVRIVGDLVQGVWRLKSRHGTAGLAGTVYVNESGGGAVGDRIQAVVHGAGGAAPYGIFWERGIKSHVIVPKTARALAWPAYGQWQKSAMLQRRFAFTADMIFAKRVVWPAQRPRPWFSGPYRDMLPELEAILQPDTSQMDLFSS